MVAQKQLQRQKNLSLQETFVACALIFIYFPLVFYKRLTAFAAQLQLFNVYSSSCSESQRESALLLGQFAGSDSDCKVGHNNMLFVEILGLLIITITNKFMLDACAGAYCSKRCCSTFN